MKNHGRKKCLMTLGGITGIHVDFKVTRGVPNLHILICRNCGDVVDYDEVAAVNSARRTRLRSSIRRASV